MKQVEESISYSKPNLSVEDKELRSAQLRSLYGHLMLKACSNMEEQESLARKILEDKKLFQAKEKKKLERDKKKLQMEREAARKALEDVEKSVYVEDNFWVMKEFERLISS